jgi:phospholipid transport system transporter-binding protein
VPPAAEDAAGAAVYALPATLTHREASATLAALGGALRAVGRGGRLRVDASALRQFDTSAIAVLLEGLRLAAQAGSTLQLVALPAPLLELAGLYGAEDLLVAPASPPT